MRGRRLADFDASDAEGLTPAYAGKTGIETHNALVEKAHPRVCGEDGAMSLYKTVTKGSPPRMRGRLHLLHCGLLVRGITPAYAGKTLISTIISNSD